MDICHYVLYGLNVAPTAILETLLTSLSSWLTYSSPVVGLSVKSAEYDWFTKPNVSVSPLGSDACNASIRTAGIRIDIINMVEH